MTFFYSPQEALDIALAHYDQLRSDGLTRAMALEATCERFKLAITPSQFDELVIMRDRKRDEEGGDISVPDTFPEEWARIYRSGGRPKGSE